MLRDTARQGSGWGDFPASLRLGAVPHEGVGGWPREVGNGQIHLLIDWTDQGIRNFRDSIERAAAAKDAAKQHDDGTLEIYWTVGGHDIVVLSEFPDDESAAAFLLKLGSLGNIRTKTMRAFNADEMEGTSSAGPPSRARIEIGATPLSPSKPALYALSQHQACDNDQPQTQPSQQAACQWLWNATRSARRGVRGFLRRRGRGVHRLALLLVRDRENASDLASGGVPSDLSWVAARLRPARVRAADTCKPVSQLVPEVAPGEEPPRNRPTADPEPVAAGRRGPSGSLSPSRSYLRSGGTMILLRFYEDLPETETARVLDRPLGTVKSDIHRALKKLRPLLDEVVKESR